MPDRWGIPVRIVSQPSPGWLSEPLVAVVIGFLLGFAVEPVKEFCRRWQANHHIYRELGTYLARFVVWRERTKATGVGGTEFDNSTWQEITRPRLPFFDHFSGKEFVFLHNPQGIQELVGRLRVVGMAYRNPNQMPFQHPDQHVFEAFCYDVISGFNQFCTNDSSKKRLAKAFNRSREAKAIGFPIPA